MNTTEGIFPLISSPDCLLTDHIDKISHSESNWTKHALTRLISVVAGAPLVALGAMYNSIAFIIKLPVTTVRVLTGWIPTKNGKFRDNFPADTSFKHLCWHAYKVTFCVVDIALFPVLGLIHPRANVWVHVKMKLCFVEPLIINKKENPTQKTAPKTNSDPKKKTPPPPPPPPPPTPPPSPKKKSSTKTKTSSGESMDMSAELRKFFENRNSIPDSKAIDKKIEDKKIAAEKQRKEDSKPEMQKQFEKNINEFIEKRRQQLDTSTDGSSSDDDDDWDDDDWDDDDYYQPPNWISSVKKTTPSQPKTMLDDADDKVDDAKKNDASIANTDDDKPSVVSIPGYKGGKVSDILKNGLFGAEANAAQKNQFVNKTQDSDNG